MQIGRGDDGMGNRTADLQIRSPTSKQVTHPNHSATEDAILHWLSCLLKGCLLEFCVLATTRIISAWVLTCDSAHKLSFSHIILTLSQSVFAIF